MLFVIVESAINFSKIGYFL